MYLDSHVSAHMHTSIQLQSKIQKLRKKLGRNASKVDQFRKETENKIKLSKKQRIITKCPRKNIVKNM